MNANCIIIIPGIPFPPVDGHKLKIYNLIKILSRHYNLHIITISREIPDAQALEFIKAHSYKYKHFEIETFRSLFILAKNIFSSTPFQVAYFTSPKIRRYIRENSEDDTYAVLNLIRTTGYISDLGDKKIIFDMVDLLSRSYFKSGSSTTSFFYKAIYKVEAKRLSGFEKKIVPVCNLTLCVNREDSTLLKEIGNVSWLPNGVNQKLFDYKKSSLDFKDSIAFFGTMFYQPNIDAVLWFEKHVLHKLNKGIKFYIIGARPTTQILNLAKKHSNVYVTGFLDDPYLILNSCFAIIAPMQNGGGIQNKILETMGMGKINVLSNYGASPIIGGKNKVHFFVETDPDLMSERINNIFLNKKDYSTIGVNARDLILKNYTWEAYEKKLITQMKHLI